MIYEEGFPEIEVPLFPCWALSEDGVLYSAGEEPVAFPPGVDEWLAISVGPKGFALGNDGGVYEDARTRLALPVLPYVDLAAGSRHLATLDADDRVRVHMGSPPGVEGTQPLGSLLGFPVILAGSETSRLPDGSFRIQFKSDFNRSYLIQYSEDVQDWKTAWPAVLGTGAILDWTDDGPPKTDTHPSLHPSRYYRVTFEP